MKYRFVYFLLFINFSIFPQVNKSTLEDQINYIVSDLVFESSLIAIDVYDLTDNKTLYNKNSKLLLHPASNMKLFTSVAALIYLGPDYKFKTQLNYTGDIKDSVLFGDLYFIGGCDPDFTLENLDSLINILEVKGIRKITGNIYGDVSMTDSLFWGKGWMWDDDPSTDAPYLTPLTINDNSIEVFVLGRTMGEKAEIFTKPKTDYVQLENLTTTVPFKFAEDFIIDRDWINRRNKIIISGNVHTAGMTNIDEATEKLNLFKPELYFLTLAKELLERKGILIGGDIYVAKTPDYSLSLNKYERRLDSVLVNMNKHSDNLSAELTMLAIGSEYFTNPVSADSGLAMIDSLIVQMNLDPENYRLVDGSGVSHYNLVSTELIINLLEEIYYKYPELFNILYKSLPIAGVDGTLKRRMTFGLAHNNVRAKTGTLSGVSALSGYLTAANNHKIAFSILVQNFVEKYRIVRSIQDRICEVLANFR